MAEETNIGNIGNVAISLGVAIIIVSIVAIILTNFKDIQSDFSVSHANETLTWAGNNTDISLLENDISNVLLYNNGTLMNQGANYTISSSNGTIRITNNSIIWNGTIENTHLPNQIVTNALNATYDYPIGSAARNATDTGISAQVTFASFIPLVALAVIGALIIGIVIRFFLKQSQ